MALLLMACLAMAGCGGSGSETADIPHTPIPKVDARLSLDVGDDRKLAYQGTVADEATRARIMAALSDASSGTAAGKIEVDADTRLPLWEPRLGDLAQALSTTGGHLELHGKRIELGGELPEEARATLLKKVSRLYPGYVLGGKFQGVDPRQGLPDAGDGPGLIAFLNMMPVNFESGTGLLLPGAVETLARAARGIQAAGNVGPLELHVYAEKSGGDARAITHQRADALATQLALRGIGPDRVRALPLDAQGSKAGTVEFGLVIPPAGSAAPSASPGSNPASSPPSTSANAAAGAPAADAGEPQEDDADARDEAAEQAAMEATE